MLAAGHTGRSWGCERGHPKVGVTAGIRACSPSFGFIRTQLRYQSVIST